MGDAFSKNGVATKYLEGVPALGYVVSVLHAAAGNKREAQRAAAKATNAAFTIAGTIAGHVWAELPGAMAGAAAGKVVGILWEDAIATSPLNEPKAEVGEVSAKRLITDTALAMLGGMGGYAGIRGAHEVMGLGMEQVVGGFVASQIAAGLLETVLHSHLHSRNNQVKPFCSPASPGSPYN